jgi:hypothetical protein
MVEAPATEPVPTAPANVERTSTAPAASAAVQQYQRQCGQAPTSITGTESQYTARCLGLLTSAIESSTGTTQIGSIRSHLDGVRSAATQLGTTTDLNAQSKHTKEAFEKIAGAFETLNPTGTNREVAGQLSGIASSMSADQPLSAQGEKIQQFFSQAGGMLDLMPVGL